jgi:hypothetical protein
MPAALAGALTVIGRHHRACRQVIAADQEAAGYITRTWTGQGTRYTVNRASQFRNPAQEGHRAGPFLDLLATAGAPPPRRHSGRTRRQIGAQRQTTALAAAAGRGSRRRADPKTGRSPPRSPARPAAISSPTPGIVNDHELLIPLPGLGARHRHRTAQPWGRPVRAVRRSPFPAVR